MLLLDFRLKILSNEIRHIVEHTSPKEWEKTLRKFYNDFIGTGPPKDNEEAASQNKVIVVMERQRHHLEMNVNQLKKNLKEAENIIKKNGVIFRKENESLLQEVSNLRKENLYLIKNYSHSEQPR